MTVQDARDIQKLPTRAEIEEIDNAIKTSASMGNSITHINKKLSIKEKNYLTINGFRFAENLYAQKYWETLICWNL